MLSPIQTSFNSKMNRTDFTSIGFFPKTKTISEIKREKLNSKQNSFNYIDLMYKTGKNFKYNRKKPYIGTYRNQLSSLENCVNDMIKNNPNNSNKFDILTRECDILRTQLKYDYNKLKNDMNNEIDNFQMKFNLELGKQKIRNNKINSQMNELKKEMLESQNLVIELKDRINSLKLRINGNEMFNQNGVPVLNT